MNHGVANWDYFMPSMRVTVTADPRFQEAIDAGIRALVDAGGQVLTYDEYALEALEALRERRAEDALPSLSRFVPPTEDSNLVFTHPEETRSAYDNLFHVMSLSMPRGVEVVAWTVEQILTAALTLYSEGLLSRPRFRVV